MTAFLKKYSLYLILLPLFFLIHNYNELFGFLLFKDILSYLISIYVFQAVLFLIFYLILKSKQQSAIIVFFISLFVLYFGSYHDFAKKITGNGMISSYKFILPISAIVIGFISAWLIRRTDKLKGLSLYLNVLSVVLIVVELFFFAQNSIRVSRDHNLIYPTLAMSDRYQPSSIPDSLKPDIYFLVFDEYTSNSKLKEFWNYDNSKITNWLSDQGFHIIANARSNYDFTPFSVSSTLNMNYIDANKGTKGYIPSVMLQSVKSISKNETINILKKENYSFRFLTPFENSFENSGVENIFNDFSEKQLYYNTFPARFHREVMWNFSTGVFSTHKTGSAKAPELTNPQWIGDANKIKKTIQNILATPVYTSNRKPQFVYGHIMIPHEPHFFDSSGNIVSTSTFNDPSNLFNTYIPQINYSNKVITELVTTIKQYNKKNTIIIIEGDHGFRHSPDSLLTNRFPIFSAIYFPSGDYQKLYDNISPVNTFRIVFNHYFYQNFPLLKDSSISVKITHEK